MTAAAERAVVPRLILCDLGDTLIRWTGYDRERGLTALADLCDRRDRFDLATLVERGGALDHDLEKRASASLIEFRQADFLRSTFASLGMQLTCEDDALESLYWSRALEFTPEDGVGDALERIRRVGVRLGVISNTIFGPTAITEELRRHRLLDFFEQPLLTSARYGIRKPHPSIFHAALGLLDEDKGNAWYIGNSVYHDVGGANAAGLTAIWYNAVGATREESTTGSERVDIEIESWNAFAELVESLR